MGMATLFAIGAGAIQLAHWVLLAAVVFIATIGFLFITRGTAVRRVRGVGPDASSLGPEETNFPVAVALLTGSSIVGGNAVEPVLDGDVFPRLYDDLRSARVSITIQMYYAGAGKVVTTLGEILAERGRAGVRVYVLYDAFGAKVLGGSFAKRLLDAGARVVPFRPLRLPNLWILQNRSHIRGVVIDSRIGWTGGFGFDDKWLGEGRIGTGWRDTSARFQGPAVLQLVAAFAASWSEATGELYTGRTAPMRQERGVAAAGLLYTAPTLGSTPAERYLAFSIAGARQRLFITNAYFAPDKNFVSLVGDAARRGVDVRLLVGGRMTDVRVSRRAAHGRYDALLAAGVRIWEYERTTLHAKTFVVDGLWSSIGTMNFDNRSLALNDESTLMIRDQSFGERMEQQFHDDCRFAVAVDAEAFRRRPLTDHVLEWAANLFTRLL